MARGDEAMMRSALGRVRGLGTAREYFSHWWVQRLTAAALVPLSIWFVVSVIVHLHQDATAMAAWAGRPWNAVFLLALLIALFRHLYLGCQVVIEDYIRSGGLRLIVGTAIKAALVLLWLAGTVAVLKLSLAQ